MSESAGPEGGQSVHEGPSAAKAGHYLIILVVKLIKHPVRCTIQMFLLFTQ